MGPLAFRDRWKLYGAARSSTWCRRSNFQVAAWLKAFRNFRNDYDLANGNEVRAGAHYAGPWPATLPSHDSLINLLTGLFSLRQVCRLRLFSKHESPRSRVITPWGSLIYGYATARLRFPNISRSTDFTGLPGNTIFTMEERDEKVRIRIRKWDGNEIRFVWWILRKMGKVFERGIFFHRAREKINN